MNTKERPPRIAGWDWQKARPSAHAVYNGSYSPSGQHLGHFDKPWTVIGPTAFETFPTHAEAIAYAFREVGK